MGGIFDRTMWMDGSQFENFLADPDAPAVAVRHICYGGSKGGGGGGGGTTYQTSTVSIPPEVLAQYQNVNNIANQAAQAPFTPYPGEMVAGVNPVQNTGIGLQLGQIGQTQPYFDAAGNALTGGVSAALPYYDQAGNLVANAANTNSDYINAATTALYGGQQAANPYTAAANTNLGVGQQQGQTMAQSALQALYGGSSASAPLNTSALGNVYGGQTQSQGYLNNAGQIANSLAGGVQGNSYADLGQAGANLNFSGIGQASQAPTAAGNVAASVGVPAGLTGQAGGLDLSALANLLAASGPGTIQTPNAGVPAGLANGSPSVDLGSLAQYMQQPNLNLSALAQGSQATIPSGLGNSTPVDLASLAQLMQPNSVNLSGLAQGPQINIPQIGGTVNGVDPNTINASLNNLHIVGPNVQYPTFPGSGSVTMAPITSLPATTGGGGGTGTSTAEAGNGAPGPSYGGVASSGSGASAPVSSPASSGFSGGSLGTFDPAAFLRANQIAGPTSTAPASNRGQVDASLQQGIAAAGVPQAQAQAQIAGALAQASPYNQQASQLLNSGLAAANPYNQAAGQGINSALAAAQPLQQQATQLAQNSAQAVNPEAFSQAALQQYMSPYTQSVVEATMRQLQQQQGMEQQQLVGNLIQRGAFGGDRGNIDRAVLANQHDMATGSILSNLYNQNYAQALGAFQQQQGVKLGADEANRAALAQSAGLLGTLGQQGFNQQLGAAQAQAGLGQQIYGQQTGTGQALGQLGQNIFGQQLAAGQANAAMGQQLFGQGATTAQTQMAAQEAEANQWAQQQQLAQQGQIAQGQLGLGAYGLQQQGQLGQGQLALGHEQVQASMAAAQAQAQAAMMSAQVQMAGIQQQGQLATQQMGLQQAQLQQQGAIAAGQLGLSQAQLAQQGQIAAGQLGIQAGQLSQAGQIALGQLSLGQASLQQQGVLGLGQLGLQQAGLSQQGQIAAGQLGLQQAGLTQQGQIAAGQLGLQQAGLQQQGVLGLGQLGLQQAGLTQQGQIAAGQLGLQQAGLTQQGQIAAGQLGLGQASLLGNLGLQQAQLQQQGQIAAGQLGLGYGQLGLGQQGLAQQGQIAQGQLGLQQAGLQQQGQIAGAQLAQQQQQNLFGQGLSLAGLNAALGQQAYGQGLSTAQFETGLANQLYGQGATTAGQVANIGQQLYGQGANTAQLQAGLGQQVFGQGATTAGTLGTLGAQAGSQGLSSAQLMAGLGQNMYGMGSNTASQLAGMGTTQQGNQLALAQSILGGGTLQQQTQQAADQAYYNQFLQQQGYPFQVAQFLAGIAEGTGALSGSTTTATTTQPGSIFSDEKLKEDKEIIGRTFDGQPVYRFAYKDDPGTTRIGLMAQDVEKSHPGAVGESNGYKTVNYDEATRAAADRGHFADGGVPQAALFNPSGGGIFLPSGGAGKGGVPGGGAGKGGVPAGGTPAPSDLQIGGHGVALPPSGASTSGRAFNPFGAALMGLAQHNALPSQLAATRNTANTSAGLLTPDRIKELIAGGEKDTKPPAPPPVAPKVEEPKAEPAAPTAAPSLFGGDDPSMDAWRRSMMSMPQAFSGYTAARGGAIDPSFAGAGFADGGAMGGDYLQQLLAQILAKAPPQYGGAGVYGKPVGGGSGPYGVQGGSAAPRGLAPAQLPAIPQAGPSALQSGMSTINQAVQTGRSLGELGKAAKEGIVGAKGAVDPKTGQAAPDTSGLFGSGGKWEPAAGILSSGYQPPPTPSADQVASVDDLMAKLGLDNVRWRGGRIGFARGGLPYGQIDDEYIPENLTDLEDPQRLQAEQKNMAAPLPAIHNSGGGGGGSAMGDIASGIGAAKGLFDIGKMILPLLARGGRAGYDEGGYVGDDNDPVAKLLEQLRSSQPDIPALPPGPREVPLDLARDRLPAMADYEQKRAPKGGASGATEPDMPPVFPHVPMPESGTRGPTEGRLPEPQSITVPAMPPLESRSIKNAPPVATGSGDVFSKMLGIESGNRQFDDKGNPITSSAGARGVAQVMPGTGPEAAKLAGLPWNPDLFNRPRTGDAKLDQEALEYNRALGKAYHDKQSQDFGDPYIGAAAYNAGPAAVRAALAKAQAQGGSYLDYLPNETKQYVMRLQGGAETGVPPQIGPLARPDVPAAPTPPQYMQPPQQQPGAASQQQPGTPPTANQPNWFDRNERAIMSILTGLGGAAAMGMNPRANLAGVLLTGLGAGAAQYAQMGQAERQEALKGRELDISQQAKQLEAAKYLKDTVVPRVDPVSGQTYYINKVTGQRMTEAQVNDLMKGVFTGEGAKGFNLQPPAQGGATPAGAPAAPAAPAGTSAEPPKSDNIVQQQTDPTYLFNEAKKYMAASNKAYEQGDIEGANRFEKIAQEYTSRARALTGADEKAKAEALAPVELSKTTATENMKTQMKARDEARAEAQNAANTVQQAQAALNLMFDPKTGQPTISGGPIGEKLTTLSAFLKQMGYSDEFVKSFTGTDPANAQALEKLRTIMGSEVARQELAGSPVRVAEFQRFLETTPSASLIPEAFKWIVNNNIMPKAQAQMKAYEAIAGLDPSKEDIQRRLYEFGRDNPWYRPPAGAQAQALQAERKEEPPQASASVPKPLQGIPGLQYSPSRGQYRDAQGNVYDSTGKKVQ